MFELKIDFEALAIEQGVGFISIDYFDFFGFSGNLRRQAFAI